MKKALFLLLALVLCLSLCACDEDENKTAANIHPDYVGEWYTFLPILSGGNPVKDTIILNENGTVVQKRVMEEVESTWRGTWRYSEEDTCIVIEFDSDRTLNLTPSEQNGHAVLNVAGGDMTDWRVDDTSAE